MKIGIITTHSFPVAFNKIHTGDIVIVDLARSLDEMGHEVHIYAPEGTYCPPNGKTFNMRASYGKYPPRGEDCELECYQNHKEELRKEDIVHDFSVTKQIAQSLANEGKTNLISTIMGGPWLQSQPPHNLVVWSNAHRDRVLKGLTDYENTPLVGLAGANGFPVKEARVVYGGIDTDFYTPTYEKKDYYLWLNRWHIAKNYKGAIELAKATGIELVMAGEHPDNEMFEYQRNCALEAVELAKGYSNIHFEFLPLDPDHHTAKRELYRQAKALLFLGVFQEPFGLSQCEAMACGTPVIGFNYGSVPEVVSNEITGCVINNNMEDLIKSLESINKISPAVCRDLTVERFDRKVMAQSYLKEYLNILNG